MSLPHILQCFAPECGTCQRSDGYLLWCSSLYHRVGFRAWFSQEIYSDVVFHLKNDATTTYPSLFHTLIVTQEFKLPRKGQNSLFFNMSNRGRAVRAKTSIAEVFTGIQTWQISLLRECLHCKGFTGPDPVALAKACPTPTVLINAANTST
ncbi:hypothetical protein EJ05DRAFT_242029 [Pseudovirgaria hyperparasitica]|uniref:Uncharacterized protein n=1 Tax=Pseudovirgaria hyperparasitica TaxID=470096 RepID=A0A6A6WDW9_9PEZI|nr:uncharacterized protein EJ05DRAFT_242029 [Pseudovirgaria hyperparasitica]KAF2760765.1 hypothetical protein EJ05DRAFT_242029 [Pseudovirgaria hyperparasitica]